MDSISAEIASRSQVVDTYLFIKRRDSENSSPPPMGGKQDFKECFSVLCSTGTLLVDAASVL